MQNIIRIGSRESRLAVIQAEIIRKQIQNACPEVRIELVTMKTSGDKILDRSLEAIGGKGLFVKELDRALLDGKIDIAVHSLKEVKENRKGKVWLAGAGPGDVGLLTVRTKEMLERADVIVYDALVSAEILCQIPSEKEIIYVGKRSGNHSVPQEEINKILLLEAEKGKRVLRLKGGDPFVFGRGGEELELLAEHRIPFEVIPGVTSAAAVPAYAGIPVTHRDYTSSFHVITGHLRKDGTSEMDYPSLVKLNGTLVFLMGISLMRQIGEG